MLQGTHRVGQRSRTVVPGRAQRTLSPRLSVRSRLGADQHHGKVRQVGRGIPCRPGEGTGEGNQRSWVPGLTVVGGRDSGQRALGSALRTVAGACVSPAGLAMCPGLRLPSLCLVSRG